MATLPEDLKTHLAGLSEGDRAELATFLIHSLDREADSDAEEAWEREIARRDTEILAGRAVGEPAAEVIARIRKSLA